MPNRSEKAAVAAQRVQELVETAIATLAAGFDRRMVNRAGVYDDPAARRGDLRRARNAIDEALDILSTISWPTATADERTHHR